MFQLRLRQKLSRIILSQLATIFHHGLQLIIQTKSNKFCRKWWYDYRSIVHLFGIGRASIYRWLSRPKLSATKVKCCRIKLDWKELEKDVKPNPEFKLADRAKKIGVNQPAIFYALKRIKFP